MNTHKHPVVLFDGVCNLCNLCVQLIIKKDKHKRFRFASLQSDAAKRMITQYAPQSNFSNTIVLIYRNKIFIQSTAVLKTFQLMGGITTCLYVFIIIPAFIRNAVYRLIANNRYRWFGKKTECMVPSTEISDRFIV